MPRLKSYRVAYATVEAHNWEEAEDLARKLEDAAFEQDDDDDLEVDLEYGEEDEDEVPV